MRPAGRHIGGHTHRHLEGDLRVNVENFETCKKQIEIWMT